MSLRYGDGLLAESAEIHTMQANTITPMITSHLGQAFVLALFCSGLSWEQSHNVVTMTSKSLLGESGRALGVMFTHYTERAAVLGAIIARKVAMGEIKDSFKDPEDIFLLLMRQPPYLLARIYAQSIATKAPPLIVPLR